VERGPPTMAHDKDMNTHFVGWRGRGHPSSSACSGVRVARRTWIGGEEVLPGGGHTTETREGEEQLQ
jgi:hypothetical protein